MFDEIWKYLTVYLSSMVKFIIGPTSGVAFGLSLAETILFTVLGMMTSVLLVSLLGTNLRKKMVARFAKNKKKFSTRNRRIVFVWKKFGLQGVAFLTPLLFTPIGGTILATAFGETPKRIFIHMLLSAVFWGLILSFLVHKLGDLAPF